MAAAAATVQDTDGGGEVGEEAAVGEQEQERAVGGSKVVVGESVAGRGWGVRPMYRPQPM